MFIDEAIITVKAGNGGDGAATFRREKAVQFGGPDGGDGGHGGDIIFRADNNINTLVDFKYKRKYQAEKGVDGAKKKMHGKRGSALVIKVPIGTQVRDLETGHLLLDLQKNHEERVLLKGGKGGLGNVHFKNAVRKAPKIAGKGKEGVELEVKLELKLLADDDFRYKVEIYLTQNDSIRGGYVGNWSVQEGELERATKVRFHVLSIDTTDETEIGLFLMGLSSYSQLVPEPELIR